MLTIRLPSADAVAEFLVAQEGLRVTYGAEGITRGPAPAGFNADHSRYRLANGTLPGHAECGEELFSIEMDASVWYDLLAYSRPRHWLARLGYPFTRAMQRRFAAGSAAALERAIASGELDQRFENG